MRYFMVCPYLFTVKQIYKKSYEYDDDGKTTVSTDILIEQQTPNSCKKEECAVWHDGRCQYKT